VFAAEEGGEEFTRQEIIVTAEKRKSFGAENFGKMDILSAQLETKSRQT
jgi:hypothetical protein